MNVVAKTKQHLSKHKNMYVVGAVSFIGGAVLGTYAFRQSSLVNAKQIQVLAYKSHQTLEVFVEALGDPGNIIQDVDTGIIYASQGQAARELGLTPSVLSKHLSGQMENAGGHRFVKLGKAMVAE